MVSENFRYSFFQYPITSHIRKNITHSYKAAKTGHDIRFGYSILTKTIRTIYSDVPACHSKDHLSYLLPGMGVLLSLLDEDISWDKRALFWAVMNAAQCYVHEDISEKSLMIGSYAFDIYFGYMSDTKWLGKNHVPEHSIYIHYLMGYAESIYAVLILSVILTDMFERTEIGLSLLTVSLFIKLLMSLRGRQEKQMPYLLLSACILSFAPIGLLFAVRNDFGLIWGLCLLVFIIHLLNKPLANIHISQCDQSSWTEESSKSDILESKLEAEDVNALQLV